MKNSENHFPVSIIKLMREGIEALSEEEQQQALGYLETQYIANSSDEKIVHALIHFHNERKNFAVAKSIGNQYLMMNGYQKEILAALSVCYLHTDEMDTYFTLVNQFAAGEEVESEAKIEIENAFDNVILFPKKVVAKESIQDFSHWQNEKQIAFLQQIQESDITPYLSTFIAFLINESGSPLIKSIIFEMMQEKNIDQLIPIEKLGLKGQFNPQKEQVMAERKFPHELLAKLSSKLESENPSLLEQLQATVQHHLFMIYPFTFIPENTDLWLEAYLYWIEELYGISLTKKAKQADEETLTAISFIKKLEGYQQNYSL